MTTSALAVSSTPTKDPGPFPAHFDNTSVLGVSRLALAGVSADHDKLHVDWTDALLAPRQHHSKRSSNALTSNALPNLDSKSHQAFQPGIAPQLPHPMLWNCACKDHEFSQANSYQNARPHSGIYLAPATSCQRGYTVSPVYCDISSHPYILSRHVFLGVSLPHSWKSLHAGPDVTHAPQQMRAVMHRIFRIVPVLEALFSVRHLTWTRIITSIIPVVT